MSVRAIIEKVLKEHADIYWNHQTGTTHCDCDAKLADTHVHDGEPHRAHLAEAIEAAISKDARIEWGTSAGEKYPVSPAASEYGARALAEDGSRTVMSRKVIYFPWWAA